MSVAPQRTPVQRGHLRLLQSTGNRLRELPWWTAADASEFDILVRALIKGHRWHLERCLLAEAERELTGWHWCKHLSAAVEEIVEWRDMREAHSRAIWVRKQLDEQS